MTWEENQYLIHYGIKGQKKGHRRFQNEDGSLTPEGKERYGIGDGERRQKSSAEDHESGKRQKKELTPEERAARKKKVKKILAIAAGVTLAAAAGYMAYKVGDQWTKNLQEEYQNQARSREYSARSMKWHAHENKRNNIMEAYNLRSTIRKGGKHYEGRARDVSEYGSRVKDALDYAKYEKQFAKRADDYAKMAKNVTRQELVRNFIKNNGSIVVPYL